MMDFTQEQPENIHEMAMIEALNAEADENEGRLIALMTVALEDDDPEFLRTLIQDGVDVNAKDDFELTALMLAAYLNENSEVLRVLIEAGADINAKDKGGKTALMIATENNKSPEVLSILTDAEQRSAGNANG